jgi:drug/metabolite transporter (DMT)-like permease
VKTKLYLSVFCVAFFWGTTFLGIRIGLETIPPFILAGLRNLISGSLIALYLIYSKKMQLLTTRQIARAFLLSILMIVLANGLTTYSEKYINSSLASLVTTLSPLFVFGMNLLLGTEKLSLKTLLGIFLSLLGMFLIYLNTAEKLENPNYQLGILAIVIAVLSWSVGTIITKKGQKIPASILLNVCTQMFFAGMILTSYQLLTTPDLNSSTWSIRSISAIFYLAIFGSVVGYIAYSYLITQWPSTKVSVLTYVNVVVALFLGWLLLDEVITGKMILATAFIIAGVGIVNYRKKLKNVI